MMMNFVRLKFNNVAAAAQSTRRCAPRNLNRSRNFAIVKRYRVNLYRMIVRFGLNANRQFNDIHSLKRGHIPIAVHI